METLHAGHPVHRMPTILSAVMEWGATFPLERPRRREPSRASRIDSACGAVLNCANLDPSLFGRAANGELQYPNHPFEVVPFGWNGGSGLSYGWAVLDEHQDPSTYSCVSFAPGDEGGARWLGDSTREALENMMVGAERYWELYEKDHMPSPVTKPNWASVCAAAGLAPRLDRTDISAGARSTRVIAPHVPSGYRFEPSPDGTGVLADASAFGDAPIEIDPAWYEDDHIAVARQHLAAGRPAAALLVLKATRAESPARAPTVEAMRDAYLALGRPFMASRANYWLAHNDAGRAQ